MNSFIFTLLFFCISLKYSFCSECLSQTVDLNSINDKYSILSDPNDLQSKKCVYTFTVPQYFAPTVVFMGIHLTNDNKITTKQYSEYGGTRVIGITDTVQLNLAPVNFTIEINLPTKTPDDSFKIVIAVQDKTPATVAGEFVVKQDLGTLIDYGYIKGNSSTVQKFDANNPQAPSYTIRVAVFSDVPTSWSLMDMVYVYDNGVYKGSLLDVYTAGNSSQVCSGKKFEIVNSVSTIVASFTILISGTQEWAETSVSVTNAPENSTQTMSATNGILVMHEISNPSGGTVIPFYYRNFTFRGDTELSIYAGCVNGTQDYRRIATITPTTAHNYENLLIYGRCKTFVLTKGYIQWQSRHDFPTTVYRHEIGRKGVIMSTNFPYPNMDNSTHNYLIQSPSADSKENIVVTYEIASMASDTYFFINQEIKALTDANKTLTPADKTYTSVSTYQQYILYRSPINSDGFLIRYTVTSSANLINFYSIVMLIILKFV